MSKNVEYIDNSKKVTNGIDRCLDIANRKILLNIQRDVVGSFTKNFVKRTKKKGKRETLGSKNYSPIDSNQLRLSIKSNTTGKGKGEVSANKNYAVHVEYGTVKMPPRPFFRKGVKDSEKENMKILQRELKKVK